MPPDHQHTVRIGFCFSSLGTLLTVPFPCHEDRVEGQRVTSLLKHVSAQRPQNRTGHLTRHPARQKCAVSGSSCRRAILGDRGVCDIPGSAVSPAVLGLSQSHLQVLALVYGSVIILS